MLFLSVLKICRALRGVTTTWKQSVQIHYVPLMFITVFSTFLISVMIFRLTVAANEDKYADSAAEWVSCLYVVFKYFHFFMFLSCHSNYKNITRIAHSYCKKITRKSMLECPLDFDEY